YAFAVLQGNKCWCSNYVPGETTSDGDCNQSCPGYPSDKCGGDGAFGYIALNRQPSGTKGGPSSTSTTPTSTSTSSTSTSTFSTSSTSPNRYIPSTTTSSTSTSTTPTSTPRTSTWTPTPVTSVMTVTGELRTVTITPTDPPKANIPVSQQTKDGFFSNAGRVAGLFTGLAIIILLVAGGVLFFLWRRHRRSSGASAAGSAGTKPSPPRSRTRSMSELGLISRNSTLMGEKSVPAIQTDLAAGGVGGGVSSSPTSPLDRRNSNARVIDQRLDPGTIWNPLHDNSSRVSVRSLQDDQDYSRRVLRLANPDSQDP
ncbi:MAG: Ribosome-releasing factor 2, mitochondrial, partial [Chaenotheca gracillima]